MTDEIEVGSIVWHDLTIEHADTVKDFYTQVVGWSASSASMGDYEDFNMNKPDSGECAAGICHALGSNADMPPQWLMYVKVADAQQSATDCEALGGKILNGPTKMGNDTYYTLQDPVGAVLAIFS